MSSSTAASPSTAACPSFLTRMHEVRKAFLERDKAEQQK
jgi:hypothetical protein